LLALDHECDVHLVHHVERCNACFVPHI
jgi:hypothetical protein